MSLGAVLALLVLIFVAVAIVFAASMPAWLPLVMIGMLALALLVGGYSFPVKS